MPRQETHPREHSKRRAAVWITGIAGLVAFLLLGSENAFNLRFLHPRGLAEITGFVAVSILTFLLLVALLFLLLRNIVKLYVSEQSRVLGSRLRTRMVFGALLLSFAPVLSMFLFSYVLMNRSIDRWFSLPVTGLREDADSLAQQLTQYAKDNATAEAAGIATNPEIVNALHPGRRGQRIAVHPLNDELHEHERTLQGGFAVIYTGSEVVSAYHVPLVAGNIVSRTSNAEQVIGTPADNLPLLLLRSEPVLDDAILSIATAESPAGAPFVVAGAPVPGGGRVLVGLPLPPSLPESILHIRQGTRDYLALGKARSGIRATFLMALTLLTVAVFFGASWLALTLSKQVTRPVESLADAMAEIAAGHYSHRIARVAANELGELTHSFNTMAGDLESSRERLYTSSAELSLLNQKLETRRVEIETILDTVPLGVLGVDSERRVLHANRAFDTITAIASAPLPVVPGVALGNVLPPELMVTLERLLRRSLRMGLASKEVELRTPRGALHLSVSVAALERRGFILVFEDISELLRAQKQLAWKEVAQRVAHEIKNPLTPISLSAERIRRYVDRGTLAASASSVRDSAETISTAVESMRTLVDQFSLLAQFPATRLLAADLNEIVEITLRLFAGRMEDIRLHLHLQAGLPPVMADANSLQRALANLVENAAEAMQGSLLREMTIATRAAGAGTVELMVADTGKGLTEEDREQIFLPWFSTKQRGTGLGLAITAQVVQEHGGTIRAEKNSPVGARFVIELPAAEIAVAEDALVGAGAHAGMSA